MKTVTTGRTDRNKILNCASTLVYYAVEITNVGETSGYEVNGGGYWKYLPVRQSAEFSMKVVICAWDLFHSLKLF